MHGLCKAHVRELDWRWPCGVQYLAMVMESNNTYPYPRVASHWSKVSDKTHGYLECLITSCQKKSKTRRSWTIYTIPKGAKRLSVWLQSTLSTPGISFHINPFKHFNFTSKVHSLDLPSASPRIAFFTVTSCFKSKKKPKTFPTHHPNISEQSEPPSVNFAHFLQLRERLQEMYRVRVQRMVRQHRFVAMMCLVQCVLRPGTLSGTKLVNLAGKCVGNLQFQWRKQGFRLIWSL